jgi:Flp pilus assembly protein TadB
MRQVNFYLDLVADEDRSKADVELRWMVQNAKGTGRFVERFLFLLIIAGAAAGGVFWGRGYQMLVYQCAGGFVALLFLFWLISKIRRHRRFKADWEMAVLKWHGARAKIKEAIRVGHPKEAMSHARDEAKARDEIMELLRL